MTVRRRPGLLPSAWFAAALVLAALPTSAGPAQAAQAGATRATAAPATGPATTVAATAGPAVRVLLRAPHRMTTGAAAAVRVTVVGILRGASVRVRVTGRAAVDCSSWRWTGPAVLVADCPLVAGVRSGRISLRAVVTAGGTSYSSRTATVTVHASTARLPRATSLDVQRCYNPGPQVWLTFDDFGSTARIHTLVRILDRAHVRGRFFVIGQWARAHPELIRYITAHGHLVMNHTSHHKDLTHATTATIRKEIRGSIASSPQRLFRPPYGGGAFTRRLGELAAEQGYLLCYWTVDTRDWAGESAASIVRTVRHGSSFSPPVHAGGVVLMHMFGAHTAQALPGVIAAIRARGLRLDPLP